MCFGLGILSRLTGAHAQAKATRRAAAQQAQNDRLMAQAAQQAQEATLAQTKASEEAAALLSRPTEDVSVQVGEVADAATDPETGRRRNPRSSFQISTPQSGLRI